MKLYTTMITIIVLGLLALVAQVQFEISRWEYSLFSNLSSTLLISGLLSLLYNIIYQKSEREELLKTLSLSKAVDNSGLANILVDSKDFNYSELIANSEKFTFIMNDGQRWIGNYSTNLERRFGKSSITEFFVVNPESKFLPALAEKTETSVDGLKNKINESVELLKRTYLRSSKKGILKIYYLKNYPTQSIFSTESRIIVTPYQIASGRNIIPLYEYKIDSKHEIIPTHIASDIENIRIESTLLFDSEHIES